MGWARHRRRVLVSILLLSGGIARAEQLSNPSARDDTEVLIAEHVKARRRVDEAFSGSLDMQSLMCTPPKHVAYVEKSKHITTSDNLDPTDEELARFKAAGVPVFDSCQVWMSEKFGFIYLRQPKSSSNQVMRAVRKDICKKGTCLPEEFRKVELGEFPKLMQKMQEFFVFTFVRNPWTRALSAYSMFHQHFLFQRPETELMPGVAPTERCSLPFPEYAENVSNLVDMCEGRGCCAWIPARGEFWQEFIQIHLGDHSHCMFLPNGEPLVDYIGLTEFFDEAWVDILATLAERNKVRLRVRPVRVRSAADVGADVEGRRALMLEPFGSASARALAQGSAAQGGSGGGALRGGGGGEATVWHAVPGSEHQGGGSKVTYETERVQAEEVAHMCNSTRTMLFLNETTVHSLARQYALDIVRLGYL